MTKKELAEKIAKEQNLDATKLMRLTVVELEKMDLVVKDQELPTDSGSDENESEDRGDGALDSSGNEEESGIDSESGIYADDVDIFSEEDMAEDSDFVTDDQEEDPSDVVEEAKAPLERKLVGHHPITKEPVYK